jgi:Tfp pilus assembly protein PilF
MNDDKTTLSSTLNRAISAYKAGQLVEAEQLCQQIVAARQDVFDALHLLALVQTLLGKKEAAIASFDRALKVRPDYAEAFCNLGVTLHEMNLFELALASHDRALKLRPDYAEALTNRGITLLELKHFKEALASFDHALKARSDFAEAHCSRALCCMLIGDFDRGWNENEWRWETEHLRKEKRNFAQPLWLGSDEIAGKTILLHGEQGFGDVIQFCRYVPLVAERGARVILEVPNSLHELMGTLTGAAQIVSRGEPLPQFDLHCPLLSLPLAFGTRLESVPRPIPYLGATPSAARSWNARLGPRKRFCVGLAWFGRPDHKNDHNRSLKLNTLLPLLDCDASFISLQREVRPCDSVLLKDRTDLIHFGDELNNFSDTAALISNLDLVISVDTSVAHLAGALGKPVWILLPNVPDWRWLLDREDSPWYPTARLFRQNRTRTWDDVIIRVRDALHHFAPRRPFAGAQMGLA